MIPDDYKVGTDGHHYKYHNESRGWTQAEEICEGEGGNLATIFDEGTRDAVREFMVQGWIGATNYWDGQIWKTVAGENLGYTSWANGHPGNSSWRCAVQRSDKLWVAEEREHDYPFICQIIAGKIGRASCKERDKI